MDPQAILAVAIGPFGALALALGAIWYLMRKLDQKTTECEAERARADESDEKYAGVLQEQITYLKERDRTLELISRAAVNNSQGHQHGDN